MAGGLFYDRDPEDAAACPVGPAMAGRVWRAGPGGAARFGVGTRGTLY